MSEGSSSRLQTARQLSNEHLQLQTDENGGYADENGGFVIDDLEELIDNNLHHQYLVNIFF